MIPRKIHFIFGLSNDFNNIPFSLCHYLAVLSAKVINTGYDITIHYYYAPKNNEWWDKCASLATIKRLEEDPPQTINGLPIMYNAHRADVIRLSILQKEGGIYLDMDTICIRPFDPLLNMGRGVVMGLEVWQGNINGLCNAVIMAKPNHPFLKLWQDKFSEFIPKEYNKLAVQDPFTIAMKNFGMVHMEPPESFFRLTWSEEDLKLMHERCITFDRSYSAHLWNGSYHRYLQNMTLADIAAKDTSYTLLARKVLDNAHSQSIL